MVDGLKMALQILGRKFYKNTEKSYLYSQSLLIFMHKTPVARKTIRQQKKLENYYGPGNTDGNHGLFLQEQLAHLHTGNTQNKV